MDNTLESSKAAQVTFSKTKSLINHLPMFIRHLCVIFPQGSQCGHKRGPGNVLEFSKIPGIGIQEVKEGHNLIIDYLHYIRHSIMAILRVLNSLECNEFESRKGFSRLS